MSRASMPLFPIMLPEQRFNRDGSVVSARRSGASYVCVGAPWSMLQPHERSAFRNHGQTLQRLAERGGLSACEALAVLDDRPWRQMEVAEANRELCERVAKCSPLPADVRRLVIAARRVAFEDQGQEALQELDAASEAFAHRVPWEDEPA